MFMEQVRIEATESGSTQWRIVPTAGWQLAAAKSFAQIVVLSYVHFPPAPMRIPPQAVSLQQLVRLEAAGVKGARRRSSRMGPTALTVGLQFLSRERL